MAMQELGTLQRQVESLGRSMQTTYAHPPRTQAPSSHTTTPDRISNPTAPTRSNDTRAEPTRESPLREDPTPSHRYESEPVVQQKLEVLNTENTAIKTERILSKQNSRESNNGSVHSSKDSLPPETELPLSTALRLPEENNYPNTESNINIVEETSHNQEEKLNTNIEEQNYDQNASVLSEHIEETNKEQTQHESEEIHVNDEQNYEQGYPNYEQDYQNQPATEYQGYDQQYENYQQYNDPNAQYDIEYNYGNDPNYQQNYDQQYNQDYNPQYEQNVVQENVEATETVGQSHQS